MKSMSKEIIYILIINKIGITKRSKIINSNISKSNSKINND